MVLHYRMKGNVDAIPRKKKEKVRESLVPGQLNYVPAAPTTGGIVGMIGAVNVNGIGEEKDDERQTEKVV